MSSEIACSVGILLIAVAVILYDRSGRRIDFARLLSPIAKWISPVLPVSVGIFAGSWILIHGMSPYRDTKPRCYIVGCSVGLLGILLGIVLSFARGYRFAGGSADEKVARLKDTNTAGRLARGLLAGCVAVFAVCIIGVGDHRVASGLSDELLRSHFLVWLGIFLVLACFLSKNLSRRFLIVAFIVALITMLGGPMLFMPALAE